MQPGIKTMSDRLVAATVLRLALGGNDGRPPFANHTKATELNGRARLITLVQRISFSSRLTFGGIRRRRLRESNAPGVKTMSDRLLAATVLRLALGGDCPATGLIFTKPPSSSEAARVALPQTAVAIVWRRFAFGIVGLALLDNDGPPSFANRLMATARNGRLASFLSIRHFSTQHASTFDWTVAATVQPSRRALLTNH
jgi:hypothetical protein